MKKLGIILNLVYSLERKLGWCPKPPATKAEGATVSTKDGGQKFKWWVFMFCFVFLPFLWLVIGILAFLLVFGILAMVFFGTVGVANIVHAYQKKENIYYFRTVLSFLMCFAGISIILGNFLLILIFFVSAFAISGLIYHSKRFRALKEEMLSK